MSTHSPHNGNGKAFITDASASMRRENLILEEEPFLRTIALERKRSERSRKPFLLMLLDAGDALPVGKTHHLLNHILMALANVTRETDVTGWYRTDRVVGVMFTEIPAGEQHAVLSIILQRASNALRESANGDAFSQITISFHVFPEEWGGDAPQFPTDPTLYPDVQNRQNANKLFTRMKRVADILGSGAALLFSGPVFLAIALVVKASSKGPIFFRQERLGQFGKKFLFYKFRTMYADNDPRIHEEFMKHVIHGESAGDLPGETAPVYKMTHDPRITPVGRFLRRTSLDELPQFFNILKGDMSLVGPRPPIAYEYLQYDVWHRRRLLEAKPGLTGLWQVKGRSRVRFDDMVRLDLRYGRAYSPWLDMKIVAKTPQAVLFGNDAF